ncbi:hypothetical protein CEUSTIGMA_g6998.t1 [Chlamydomonas eustigma]|uniref:Uncharacterized protein n=1 Tax=Chlamydomonas eustigma TaxID=1157962 RepID=A0A250X927_9CHLO|nr:hypothetical protein CEUSTIGMA_g6998.t1 [Chlamydomonas eustigma]|eukprot:GAX79557.1 hypothetical protein CEUSTIGMA_g6998.t1 [Chlamydomonas eustigma]
MGSLVEELILHDLLEEEELEELKLSRLVDLSSEHDIGLLVYCFCALKPGESIRQYLSSVTSSKRSQLGPCRRESLVHLSPRALKDLNLSSLEEGQEKLSKWWDGVAMLRQEWQTHLRSAQRGDFQPFVFRAVLFGDKEGDATQAWNLINWPAVIIDEHGVRHWGMVRQGIRASGDFLQCWALRDLLAIKHTTAGITVVSVESGCVMWQNAASMAMMGCHGSLNSEAGVSSRRKRQNKIQKGEQGLQGHHYLDLLFYAHKEDLPDLNATVQRGGTFCKRVEITHPVLRYLMGLGDSPHFEEAHHDVEVTVSRDPVTLERAYTISQAGYELNRMQK